MKLSREAIQRMISQKPGTSNVTVINQGGGGGGGGVILGPLLTSLNAEAMPSAEGYLHWSGAAWEWTTPTGGDPVDLTPYALKTWVETNYASKDDISEFITESQAEDLFAAIDHTHDNYLPLSAGANKALTGSLYITGSNGIQWAGSPGVGMLCYMPSSGWTGISASQWGVGATSAQGVIRSNANDILHYRNGTNYKIWDAYNFTPSDYLPLTGGTVESLTVTNDLGADSITVGSLVNSNTLAEYLDADAMQTWGDGRYLKLTDKAGLFTQLANYDGALQITIGGTQKSLTIAYANAAGSANTAVNADKLDNHHAADFALASSLGNYLPLTGGTVNGNLNVKGTIQAQDSNGNNKIMIYGTTGNIRAEKVYIGGSTSGYEAATHDWVTSQGYQANVIETVKVAGTALTPTNKAVDIPAATSDGSTFGVVAIGTGFSFDEGRLCVDTSTFATRTWADSRYLPLTAGRSYPLTGDLYLSEDLVLNNEKCIYFKNHSGTLCEALSHSYDEEAGIDTLYLGFDFRKNSHSTEIYGNKLTLLTGLSARARLVITSGGNIGIGTDSPAEKLDVAGNVKANGATLTNLLSWNVANADNLIISNNKIQLSVSGTPHNIMLFEGSTASLTSYAKFYDRPMVKTGTDNGTPVYTNVALVSEVEAKQNIIHFFNTKNSNTEVSFSNIYLPLSYQGGGTVYLDLSDYATTSALSGYLPLTAGSSKPLTGSLYVTPGAGIHQTVEIRGSQYNIGLTIGAGNVNRGLYGYTIGGSNDWLLYFNASNTILNYGNVGIGTTTPAVKLDVNGVAKANYMIFKKYNDSNNAGYCGRGNGSNNNIYLMSYADNLCLGANSSSNDIYINTSHNVGIGTTTPQAKLDVNGSVVIAGALAGVTNIDGLMIFDATNAQVSTRYINIGEEYYRMSIYADDEAAKFDGATDGAYYFLNGGSTPNGSIYAGSGNFSGNLTAGNRPSDADQKLYVGGSAVITGSMGIGTRPTGNYAVEVDGSVYASSSVHADSFVNNSDIRMKDVTRFIEPSVHDIAIAPIIEFKWKKGDGSKNLGTIAQYWQTVFPQAVHEGGDGMLSIEYANIALASAITAARHSLDNERRIAELELRVAELEGEMAAMVSHQSKTTEN